jgi:hypothetical protein
LSISDNDAADLLAYVELLTYRLRAKQDESAPRQHQHHH